MECVLKNIFNKYNSVEFQDFNLIKDNNELLGTIYEPDIHSHKWNFIKSHQDEETMVKNYGNPSFSIYHSRLTIVLEKDDDKVSLKYYVKNKSRKQGNVYFSVGSSMNFITYNIKDKNFYTGSISNYHKKRKKNKSLRKNTFYNKPAQKFFLKLKNVISDHASFLHKTNTDVDKQIKDIYVSTVGSLLVKYSNEFINQTKINLQTNDFENLDHELYKFNLLKKNFKLPDNYKVFLNTYPIFSLKESKNSNHKLIDCVMNRMELKGKKFKKVLHSINNFNPNFFKSFIDVFGKEVICMLPENYLIKLFERSDYYNLGTAKIQVDNVENLIEIIKLVLDGEINLLSLNDHIIFYNRLKTLEPIKWKSKCVKSFNDEHILFSERIEYFNNGIYKRIYDPKFVEEIEKPIGDFYPVVLNDTKSYVDESTNQQNCVRTYIKRPRSFIVSLRHGEERATLEYNIWEDWKYMSTQKRVYMKRVQSLGRFNKSLDEKWNIVLKKLDERIDKYLNNNEFILPKIRVIFHNGEQFETGLKFLDGNGVWDKQKTKVDIENLSRNYIYDNIDNLF